jgi:hypothetical protein
MFLSTECLVPLSHLYLNHHCRSPLPPSAIPMPDHLRSLPGAASDHRPATPGPICPSWRRLGPSPGAASTVARPPRATTGPPRAGPSPPAPSPSHLGLPPPLPGSLATDVGCRLHATAAPKVFFFKFVLNLSKIWMKSEYVRVILDGI